MLKPVLRYCMPAGHEPNPPRFGDVACVGCYWYRFDGQFWRPLPGRPDDCEDPDPFATTARGQ